MMSCEYFTILVIILIILVHTSNLTYQTENRLMRMQNRRIHVYGVGVFKSGTTSLACVFKNYCSGHEYEKDKLLNIIAQNNHSNIINYIIDKDRRYSLEMDSSGLNVFLIPYLLYLYPECKFILTIRNIIDHYDSIINDINNNLNSVKIAVYIMGKSNINIPNNE